jgi:hypothetical protein
LLFHCDVPDGIIVSSYSPSKPPVQFSGSTISRKIIFIDGDRLSGLISDLLPNFWTDVSLQIGDYLHGVWTENDRLDKSLSLITNQTERFYIDQDVFESEEFDRKKRKPRKKADIHDQINRNSVVLIHHFQYFPRCISCGWCK